MFSLGERIRKAREDLGVSQQQMADALGVDRKTIGTWEKGQHTPRYRDLMLISSVSDVSLEWLAGELFRPHAGRDEAAPTPEGRNRSSRGYAARGAAVLVPA